MNNPITGEPLMFDGICMSHLAGFDFDNPTKKQELALRLLRAIREEDQAQYCCVVNDLMELAKKPEGFMSRDEFQAHYEYRIQGLDTVIFELRREIEELQNKDDWGDDYDSHWSPSLDSGEIES